MTELKAHTKPRVLVTSAAGRTATPAVLDLLKKGGSSGIRVGNRSRVEIEPAEVEVDGGTEAVAVAEAPGRSFEPLNLGIEAFDAGVGDTRDDGIEDAG